MASHVKPRLRIAVGGVEHETNTFAVEVSGTTGLSEFSHFSGDEMLSFAGTRTPIGGMIDEAAALGIDLVPTYFAVATPSGTIERDAYLIMKQRLLDALDAAGHLDAVALELHGAGVVEGIEDLEGDLTASIRAALGPDVVIGASFDLHGNLTQFMADQLDLSFGCHLYPHTDFYDRGRELIGAIPDVISGTIVPVTYIQQLPLLLPTSSTDLEPAALTNECCAAAEAIDGVIDATFFHGFPYTDIGATGVSISVTTDNDIGLAQSVAQSIGDDIWARRDSFFPEGIGEHTAISVAQKRIGELGGPVVINDTSDNPGGGAPGDATHLLRAMIEADLERVCFGFIFDPAAVELAIAAGVGNRVQLSIGGHHDERHGAPVGVEVYVVTITDGRFVYTNAMVAGVNANLGPCARVRIEGSHGDGTGVDVILSSVRQQTLDEEIFLLHGIDVRTYDLVALKGSSHFRAGFTDLASAIVTADTPGLTTQQVTTFEYTNLDTAKYPVTNDVTLPWHQI
ncbi:M81 family metallopeptidase [Acidimicrobiaceae bacterium AH-315-P05]|nr:M81 family metallopeptidase [Acidimicrobiaceae bacterium AH-315-P05]